MIVIVLKFQGSSPHTWRILSNAFTIKCQVRIISTYVENTSRMLLKILVKQDHLHIRGEYSMISDRLGAVLGSSPHTWRILCNPFINPCVRRIISTYVENTLKESYDSSILKRCNRPNTLLLPNFKALIFPH